MTDSFGDRMKLYEMMEAGRCLLPMLPIMARIDGRCFSTFTRDMQRPYDTRLSALMQDVTVYLTKETNANCGYTQSDEITLTWYAPTLEESPIFNYRIQKLTSVLASMTTAYFIARLGSFAMADYVKRLPNFDCRVWSVPTLEEGANCFLWREQDATKNAISMATRVYYSHSEIMNKSGAEQQEMLFKAGVNFNDYPAFFKRGTFIQKTKTLRKFTADEIENLPPKHNARTNPNLMIERTDWITLAMPPFSKVENRVGVVYNGERPIISRQTWEECKQSDSK